MPRGAPAVSEHGGLFHIDSGVPHGVAGAASGVRNYTRSPERHFLVSRASILHRSRLVAAVPAAIQAAGSVYLHREQLGELHKYDAHVVVCARRAGQPILTSDPADLHRLDPKLDLVAI